MDRTATLTTLLREQVIGIVRLNESARVLPVLQAIHAGGEAITGIASGFSA